jgi:hypothetical protein
VRGYRALQHFGFWQSTYPNAGADLILNLPYATMTYAWVDFAPVAVAVGFPMSSLQRLAGVTDTVAHLNAQIRRIGNNDLPWVITYLTGLTGLIWLGHMAGTRLHLLHAA